MRKFTFFLFTVLLCSASFGQQLNYWTSVNESSLSKDIFVAANSQRPIAYKIFSLDETSLKSALMEAPAESVVPAGHSAFVLSFPMPDGTTQNFRVVNAPVMAPELAARYPGINSYLGAGIEDPSATIRFDVSMHGLHAIILSASKSAVYIDQLYQNYYRIVKRSDVTDTPVNFKCLTDDIPSPSNDRENSVENVTDGKLRTYRLAMISGAEFSNHFIPVSLPTLTDSIAAVLAAQNSHVTRSNAVYERDFAIRMVLVANNDLIIYFNPGTDPIANPNNPSGATMQATIDGIIGSANYDIGHTESKGSDNGNAGCIGCVCTAGQKGRGWTVYSNPSLLEFFVIDYLTHEMGHQFGANHTFSFQLEGTGVNIEPGSGVTIMGYAGIVAGQNVAPHSIELFSVKSIEQISNYILTGGGSGCDVETVTGNSPPTADAGPDWTIPFSTPFKLTGVSTDPDAGDVLTYNFEQIDNRTGAFPSIPVSTATNGPMFRTYLSYSIPERTFPELQYILTGANGFMWEVLPSVGRAVNIRYIVKDNHPGGGCTRSDDMVVNVSGAAGPFLVTAPNTAVNWQAGTSQTVTWSVNGSDLAPVNCANVKISFSSDGGLTFPTVIAASTPNDGTENITVPGILTTTARIKVEAVGNIFFDISNTNFTVSAPPIGFSFNSPAPAVSACPAAAFMDITLATISNGGFSNPITLTSSAPPAGTTVSFLPSNIVTPGNNVTVRLTGTNTLSSASYVITVTGTATGAPNQTVNLTYTINPGAGPAITGQPANQTVCVGQPASFTVVSATATSFQWELSTDGGATWNNIGGATSATYTIASTTAAMNNNRYRCVASAQCGSTTSNAAILTVNTAPAITAHPQSVTLCAGSSNTFSATATGTGLTYQWQSSSNGCSGPFTDLVGATSSNYTVSGITVGMNNTGYRVVVSGSCAPPATSNCALLTVVTSVTITSQPGDVTACAGSNASFTVAGSGTGIIYQWQISTDGGASWTNIAGANAATYTITGVTVAMNGYKYRAQLSNSTCTTPGTSNAATLTVNTLPAISAHPQNATICVGGSNTFSVSASGTGITYQWQLSTDGGATYNNISGATASSYTVSGATAAMNDNRYRVVVSGTCAPAATSNTAILTVISPVSINAGGQPANAEVCSGSNTNFTVAATSTQTIVYQWQVSTDGGATWSNISGANATTLSLTGVTTPMNNNRYRVQLSNATCTVPTISNAAVLTVRTTPTVGLTAAPLTSLLPGQSTTLTAAPSASTGGTLTTTWFFNTTAITNSGNTRVVNVEQVGDYQVRIQETWPSGLVCSNQSAVVTISATASTKLFIFPSPNDGRFTVSYFNNGGTSTQRSIVIFDSKGSQVYNRKFTVTGSYTLISIDLQQAGRGIYYVVVGDANGAKLADGKVHIR